MAAPLVEQFAAAASSASSEEDLRVEFEILLRDAVPELPTPRYEASVRADTFAGRADALHRHLVVEYKKPRLLRQKPKRAAAVDQVCEYLEVLALGHAPGGRALTQDDEDQLSSTVALVTDGERFLFVQRRARAWHTDERKLDEDSIDKLLLWVRAMNRKELSAENLIADFGPEASIAQETVYILAELVHSGRYPKADVIYKEWQRIFGIVYGEQQLRRPRKAPEAKALSSAYDLKLGVDFSELLFGIQTYYALLMKLLATEVIVAQGGFGESFIGSLSRSQLHDQLRELESGAILQRYNIRNAIEQDFFGWYPEAWTDELEDVLWRFAQTLLAYDIGTFQLRPDRARDLLKDLYHGLIPEAVRHALGEYYTPDWLAEHTLSLAGYDGDPRRALLDPACGSGTFLVMAIQRIREWLSDRSVEWGSNRKKLEAVDLIRRNIVGFDLNPLAVIASRTNYLFALGPLLRYRSAGSDFEIPVYLTDSVLLPGRSSDEGLFALDTVSFPMTVGTFNLPRTVVDGRKVPDLMNLLHDCIADGVARNAFVARAITDLELAQSGPLEESLRSLFMAMKELDQAGKNRVWTKLIRNRYAALFFRHYFDLVVGNPPHINWESLTPEWRKAAEGEYRRYGLFTLSGLASRHGGGKKDIAALFTYAVTDHFLKDDGVLALVVHVSLFKTSGAGEGFRRFQLGDDDPFAVEEAHDFSSFQPFQTHARMRIKTRTVTFCALKGSKTKYPVPYTVWTKTERGFIPGNLTWAEASARLAAERRSAIPLRGMKLERRLTPWLTVPTGELPKVKRFIAPKAYEPSYEGHAGIYTGGLNGAFFLDVLERNPNGTVFVRNRHDDGRNVCPQVRATIESGLVYPILRGRGVGRWRYQSNHHVLIVQDPETQRGYDPEWLQETHPLTWAYLKKFERLLRKRKAFIKFFDPNRDPFYSMYAIGTYTFAPFKVAWMDICDSVKATVIAGTDGTDMVIPEHTVIFLTTQSEEEAHYVAAVLNSQPVGTIISGYIVDNHLSTHPIENVVIPRFDAKNKTHGELAQLSCRAHEAAAGGNARAVREVEAAIDEVVFGLV